MKRKLSIVARAMLATATVVGGVTIATAAPAQAAVSCSGSVCIDVADGGPWYTAKVWFRWTSGRPNMWGHLDLWGPGLSTKHPTSGDKILSDGDGSPSRFVNASNGWVCGEAWAWNGLTKRFESWGRTCKQV